MTYLKELPPELLQQGERPFIIAHRGNRAQAPENSRAAFQLALDQGAHALETDLHITKDKQIVCIHDPTVDRTTTGTGDVATMTLQDLKQLCLTGNGDDIYGDEQIITLGELLTTFRQQTYFLLELKEPAWQTDEDVQLLLETLEEHQALDRIIVASFSQPILDRVIKVAGEDIPVAPIMMYNWWPPTKYPLLGVIWPMLYLNPLYVWLAHRRGQIFCPLDPTPEPRLQYYLRLGVDFVLSDNPALTIETLKKLRK